MAYEQWGGNGNQYQGGERRTGGRVVTLRDDEVVTRKRGVARRTASALARYGFVGAVGAAVGVTGTIYGYTKVQCV